MRFGMHLPQAGPAASAPAIRAVAKQAEELGFSDVWVSDHLAVPKDTPYPPSAYILEPLVALTWAAAATERVRLGTTVLVLPLRPPVLLAKMLASLDLMSEGRVILGAAGGWLKAEFDALGVPFDDRGARTDETIDIMRRCWTEDPIDIDGAPSRGCVMTVQMRTKPQPERNDSHLGRRPQRARLCAAPSTLGDGWHGAFQSAGEDRSRCSRSGLRRDRPEDSFTLSMRARWDALRDSTTTRSCRGAGRSTCKAGIQHMVVEPSASGIRTRGCAAVRPSPSSSSASADVAHRRAERRRCPIGDRAA